MKRRLVVLVLLIGLCLTACGNTDESVVTTDTIQEQEEAKETEVPIPQENSLEEIKILAENEVTEKIGALEHEYEKLFAEINSYELYCNSIEKIEAFYGKNYETAKDLALRLRAYSISMAETILNTAQSTDDKYEALDELYDCIYEDMGDEVYDGIYEGILEEMYDAYYDDILKDAQDTVDYKEWSESRSQEYEWWSDTRSDVYKEWSDLRSDVYGFWSDLRGDLWDDDEEEAWKTIEKFRQKCAKLTGETPMDSEIVEIAFSYDKSEFENMIAALEKYMEVTVSNMEITGAHMLEKIGDSYVTYEQNKGELSAFYENSLRNSQTLYADLQNFSADCFKCIAEQKLEDYDAWNDAMEDFYDTWNDGMEDYYNAWNDVYEEVYEKCNEVIEDASDELDYDVYSDTWEEMYETYSDAWEEMYETYSDAWEDTYDAYSDVWSEFYDGNADVDKILNRTSDQENREGDVVEEKEVTEEADKEEKESNSTEEIRPEFKEAMDSYEKFFDEYVVFMKKYKEADSSEILELLDDYADYMKQYAETMEKMEALQSDDLSNEELLYYTEVQTRISKKLIETGL